MRRRPALGGLKGVLEPGQHGRKELMGMHSSACRLLRVEPRGHHLGSESQLSVARALEEAGEALALPRLRFGR